MATRPERPKILGEQPTAPAPRKGPRQAAIDNSPWLPPAYELADVSAMQALARGEASPDQQRRLLKWVVESAAGTYDMSYRPGGEDGRRDTDFAEGRRFVGQQIVKLLRLNLMALRGTNPQADQREPKD